MKQRRPDFEALIIIAFLLCAPVVIFLIGVLFTLFGREVV
jgi:hypothetical protein